MTITRIPLGWRLSSIDQRLGAIPKGTVRASALRQAQAPDALQAREALESIREEIREAAAAYAHAGAIELTMPCVVASAGKP